MNIAVVCFQSAILTLGRAPQYHPTIIMEPLGWGGVGVGSDFPKLCQALARLVSSLVRLGLRKYQILLLWFIPITASYTLWLVGYFSLSKLLREKKLFRRFDLKGQ